MPALASVFDVLHLPLTTPVDPQFLMPEYRPPWRTTAGAAVALIAIIGGPLLGDLLGERFVWLVAAFHLSMWSLWVFRRI